MEELTLKELCDECGISRRAVQGYEKAGLVKYTGKTKMGYLTYNEEAVNKVKKIKRYRDYGFRVNEISDVFKMNKSELIEALEIKKAGLQSSKKSISDSIKVIEKEIETLKS